MFEDLLCHHWWRMETYDIRDNFTTPQSTDKQIVQDAMDNLTAELERQTGVALDWRNATAWEERCCYILFAGAFYGAGCSGYHVDTVDGGYSTSCNE